MPARVAAPVTRFALSLGGGPAGFINGLNGGSAFGVVVVEPPGPDHLSKKHLAQVGYEDVVVELGLSISASMNAWIKSVFAGQQLPKNGSIYTLNKNGAVVEELKFFSALITEVGFPVLDASVRTAAFMTLRIKAEAVRTVQGGVLPAPAPGKARKPWLASNFRFKLGQLPAARVSKIEVFSLKQNLAASVAGGQREQFVEPSTVDVPNLRVTLANADAPSWRAWFEEFVVQGNNADDRELAGLITWLAPDLRTELGTLTLNHTGIFRFSPERAMAGGAKSQRVVADLYCETMSIGFAG
jgi:hypothetical protein